MKTQILLNLLILFTTHFTLSDKSFAGDKDIGKLKVGVIFPFSGSQKLYGKEAFAGLKVALEKFTEENPELAKNIIILKKDDHSRPSEARKAAEELIKENRANILFGSITNSSSFEIAKVANRLKKPMVIPVSTKPGITNLGKSIFRSASIDPFQGKILSMFAINNLKITKVAIITNQDSEFSTQIGNQFEKSFTELGGKITSNTKYSPEKKEYKFLLKKIMADKPQALIIPSRSKESGEFLKLISQMNYKIPVIGSDGWDFRALTKYVGKKSLSGHYYSTQFSTKNNMTSTQDFVGRFKKNNHRYPSQLAALTYDGFMLICEAFKKAKSIRTKPLIRALSKSRSISGVTGEFSINKKRNAEKTYVILKTNQEKSSFESIITPQNNK